MQLKKILLKLRSKINEIDELIVNLLYKRRKIAIQIAKKKIANNFPIKDKNREQELLNKLSQIGKLYQLPTSYIKKIFETIIEDSVMIQKNIKTTLTTHKTSKQKIFSFLGPYGSYSYIASIKFIKKYYKNYIIKEYNNFKDIFVSIKSKQSNYAIVPIENNTSGFIHEVYSVLCLKKLNIIGDFFLPIQHSILSIPNTSLKTIQKVYSHNQIFQQCSKFISKFQNWNIKYTHSTSEAMKIVSQKNTNKIAAIGDRNSAKFYKLHTILKNISNKNNNHTRFLIITKKNIIISEIKPKKTTIVLKTKETLLFEIIILLNANKIHSFQLKSEFFNKNKIQEIIYLEIEENLENKNMKNIIKILTKKNILIKILGCYPTFNVL